MNALLALLGVLCILGLAAMGCYLVVTEHYGWAWIPFLMSGCVSVKQVKEKPEEPTKSVIEI